LVDGKVLNSPADVGIPVESLAYSENGMVGLLSPVHSLVVENSNSPVCKNSVKTPVSRLKTGSPIQNLVDDDRKSSVRGERGEVFGSGERGSSFSSLFSHLVLLVIMNQFDRMAEWWFSHQEKLWKRGF